MIIIVKVWSDLCHLSVKLRHLCYMSRQTVSTIVLVT